MRHHSSSYSLTSEMNSFSQNPRVPAAQESQSNVAWSVAGVRVHYFLLLASVNSLSSPVNGSSEAR